MKTRETQGFGTCLGQLGWGIRPEFGGFGEEGLVLLGEGSLDVAVQPLDAPEVISAGATLSFEADRVGPFSGQRLISRGIEEV